ncbi:MAG: DUF4446 family protein [Clostridiales bacterium]|nr:DUF4446 family protein [Clostridiales bacterium]
MIDFLYSLDLEQMTGIPADAFVLGLAVIVVILLIIVLVNAVKTTKMRKSYKMFMEGKNGQSLENILQGRLKQVEHLMEAEEENKEQIQIIMDHLDHTYQKIGLVKYNAFEEMGGKLSFSLALLNRKNDGFILNAMHSREGCFTYIKEVINGNPIIMLADEEREALDMALKDENN